MAIGSRRVRRVLKALVVNLDETVSRETLAMVAGSREQMWLAIRALRLDGFDIRTERETGYRLVSWDDATTQEPTQ